MMMVEREVEAHTSRNREQPEQQRTDSKARTSRLDRRYRDRLRRRIGCRRRRGIDLREHASPGRRLRNGRSSGSAAYGDSRSAAAHDTEDCPGVRL